jgi:hypothetical protein
MYSDITVTERIEPCPRKMGSRDLLFSIESTNDSFRKRKSRSGTTLLIQPDPIFHLSASVKADTDPNKINLGIGAYRDGPTI